MKKFNKILSYPIRNGNPRGHTLLNKLTINSAFKRQLQSFKQGDYTKVLHLAQISGKEAKKKKVFYFKHIIYASSTKSDSWLLTVVIHKYYCLQLQKINISKRAWICFFLAYEKKKNNETNFREFLKHCFTSGNK